MKKLAFMFVAVAAISFASCGNKTSQAEVACDSVCCDSNAVEEVVDSAVVAESAAVVDSAAVVAE